MSFIESPRFPEEIAYGSQGGPQYYTEIVLPESGQEIRNAAWTYPRHRYNASHGVKTHVQMEALIAFFHNTEGRNNSFRYKDHLDYKSCALAATPANTDQSIGTGDGSTVIFQLSKTYTSGSETKLRNITKPVTGST